MDDKLIKILSVGATMATMGGQLIMAFVNEKKTDKRIADEVIKQLAIRGIK